LTDLVRQLERLTGDEFVIVFDGESGGAPGSAAGAARVVFSSAREGADRVLARMARRGGAVVSNDRAVQRAAAEAGAIAISTDDFLARIASVASEAPAPEDEEDDDRPAAPRKGNPRRPSKKARAAARALGRLRTRGR
jgi:hypothetical protein